MSGCDGLRLALAVGTAFLGGILRTSRPKPIGRLLSPHRPLPHAIDLTRLRVSMRPLRRDPAQG
ncbi:hypothetical protein [Nonomuraea fuscirosea]